MNPRYNIYRQLNGNAVAWVDRVNGLDEAEERVVRLEQASPGNHIIFDVRERTVVRVRNAWPQSLGVSNRHMRLRSGGLDEESGWLDKATSRSLVLNS